MRPELRQKRHSQAAKSGSSRGRRRNGLSDRSIHRSAWTVTPGAGRGFDRPGLIQPAFPREAAMPSSSRSRTVTSAPRLRRYQAQARPITPPPTTATFNPAVLA